MKIVKAGHPALTVPAAKVEEFDARLADLIAEMYQLLDSIGARAAALAAPQVGISERVFVYSFDGLRGHMVNPTIVGTSAHRRPVTEGCLTFPDRLWRVKRYIRCQTTAFDRFGHVHVNDWAYFPAQVMQHEIDHLNGILLPDVALRQVPARAL